VGKKQLSVYVEEEDKTFLATLGEYMDLKEHRPKDLSYVGRILLDKGIEAYLKENGLSREDIIKYVEKKKKKL